MSKDPKEILLSLLPAGEWSEVVVLNQPSGMMADRNWAILAKANWLRQGGRKAFIKFIVPAGSGAGTSTQLVTGTDRLRRIERRLQDVKGRGNGLPLVQLLEVSLQSEGLLIAMEDVRTLYDLIEIGQAYDLSARVLSDLDPEKPGVSPPWMHYDISPENIGVTGGGALVLIDVDSFYLEEAGKYRVSVPAWKPFRAPQALADEVRNRYAANRIDGPIAKRKMRFELALAAAECVLGPLPPSRDPVDRSLLAKWVATADSNDSAVAFWTREMSEILVDGDVRPLADIAKELNVAIKRGASTVHAPRAVPRTVVAVSSEPPEVSRAEATTKTAPDEWSAEWNLLRPSAHALRAGQLDRVRVEEYRKVLETLIERYPKRVELWDELLLIVISYQKDRAAATTIIERARQALPNNAALEQLHNVVKNWVAGD